MPRLAAYAFALFSFLVPLHAQDCAIPRARLVPSSSSANQRFGFACALSGDTLAAMSIGGSVRVYTREGGTWSLAQAIPATTTGPGEASRLLALDGDWLAIGRPRATAPSTGEHAGAVALYHRRGGAWSLHSTLDAGPADADEDDRFGYEVALVGERLIVGAPDDDEAGEDAGAAWSFRREGGSWTLEAKLLSAAAGPHQYMGRVAFDGRRCLVSHGSGDQSFVWKLRGGTWLHEATLPAGGFRLAIQGDLCVVNTLDACGTRRLRTFERVGASWLEDATWLMGEPGGIALHGGRLAAGWSGNEVCWIEAEPPRVYSRVDGAWHTDIELGPAPGAASALGGSVAFDGESLVVGDTADDEVAQDAGAVWVYQVGAQPECPETYCSAKVNSLGCTPHIFSSGESSASADSGFVLGVGGVLDNVYGRLFYGFSGPASAPFLGGTLCVATPLLRGPSTYSGDDGGPIPSCAGALTYDMNAYAAGVHGYPPASPLLSVPGTEVWLQWWARDPGFPPPDDVQLSAAFHYTVLP